MKTAYSCFILIALTLYTALGHADSYTDLAADWEDWSPPAYPVPPSGAQDDPTDPPAKTGPEQSGHTVWQSQVSTLLEQGRFIHISPEVSPEKEWTVKGAADAIHPVLNLKVIQAISLGRNPKILAAQAAFQAELEGFGQVEDLNAVLSQYAAFTDGIMPGVGPMKSGSSKGFPFPGSASLKTRVIVENAAMAALDFQIDVRNTVTSVTKAYWDLVLVHEKLDILKETLRLYEHLHDIASTMYKTGKTSYQDVIQISIKTKVLGNQIVSLKEEKTAAQTRLLALLDLPAHTRTGRPYPAPAPTRIPPAAALVDLALQQRQEILKMDHAIKRMELMIEMSENMVLPSRDMGLSENKRDQINTTGTWAKKEAFAHQAPAASTGAGHPKKPWLGTTSAWLAQTRKKLAALKHTRQNLGVQTRAAVQSAWARLDNAQRTYALYKNEIIDLSSSALDVSTKEYESGRISFADAAGAYSSWLSARLSLVQAKTDAGRFRADLEKTAGFKFDTDLDRPAGGHPFKKVAKQDNE